MAKSPGFWFFTGDWLKDPELRFCSIFARGLLVDLLCILFEANERGYASKPNGEPRSDEEIVDAVSGGSREQKLQALRELEASGALSRDNRGVLFSRRLARLAEINQTRKQSGSKGGSKTQAKLKQNIEQSAKQKAGVSVSVSDTFLDISESLSDPERENSSSLDLRAQEKEILDFWNNSEAEPKVRKLSPDRLKKLRARLKDCDWPWREAIERLPIPNDERFTWQPDFDWLIANDKNAYALAEGKYSQKSTKPKLKLASELMRGSVT